MIAKRGNAIGNPILKPLLTRLALAIAGASLSVAAYAASGTPAAASGKPAATAAGKPSTAGKHGKSGKGGKNAAAPKKTSGKKLTQEAAEAVAGIMKQQKASGGKLDVKNKKQAPFWGALQDMGKTLRDVEAQSAKKDKKLASTLSHGTEVLAKVKVAWPRLGVKDAKVDSYLQKLDNSYATLRARFGTEGARAKKGGQLTPAEKARLDKIKASQKQFAAKLAPIQAKAKAKGDRGTELAVTRLIDQSNRVVNAPSTVDSYLTTLVVVDVVEGEWDSYRCYYAGPEYRDDFHAVDTWVQTEFTSYDVIYEETIDVSYTVDIDVEISVEASIDFEVTDVSYAEVSSVETSYEESYTYEEYSWESYASEQITEESEHVVYEEEEVNLDVAEETWHEEGLDVSSSEELLDHEDQEEYHEEVEEYEETHEEVEEHHEEVEEHEEHDDGGGDDGDDGDGDA